MSTQTLEFSYEDGNKLGYSYKHIKRLRKQNKRDRNVERGIARTRLKNHLRKIIKDSYEEANNL